MARSKTAPVFKRYDSVELRTLIKHDPETFVRNYCALEQAVDTQARLILDWQKKFESTRKIVVRLFQKPVTN